MTLSLRQGLALTALLAAAVLGLPRRRLALGEWLAGVGVALLVLALLAIRLPVPGVVAAAVLLLGLSRLHACAAQPVLQVTGEALIVLALYRAAYVSVPAVWLAADWLGQGYGALAGFLTRQPLQVGTTFAALDVLLPLLYVAGVLPLRTVRATRRRLLAEVAWGIGAVLISHLAYLVLASITPWVLSFEALRAPEIKNPPAGATPPPPGFLTRLHVLLPWNLPAVAVGVQLAVAAVLSTRVLLRRGWSAPPIPKRRYAWAACATVLALAAVLPLYLYRSVPAPEIRGRKIVLFEEGFLNWMKPEHGQYGRLSVGMYGMMPIFLESLGLQVLVSPDLSATDLAGASAVVMLFPNEPWEPGQLERIWAFVREGGTLLVMGEHTTWEEDAEKRRLPAGPGLEISRFNEVLAPTAMRVAFDSATFAVGGWLHSYEALAHPTTAGIRDEENDFGCVIGASLAVRWPARPLIVGRWGWADPGDVESKRAMMGNGACDPGERLGDLVLAAEQPFGKGRIIAFGDTSGLTNGLTVGCHDYTSRLYAYLVGGRHAHSERALWLCLAGFLGAVVLLLLYPRAGVFAATGVILAVFIGLWTRETHRAWDYLPDGRMQWDGSPRRPNNLAYIESSHLGPYSPESWRPHGLGALALTLMRNGFLTLNLPEISAARLERARLLISVAPAKPFSPEERRTIEEFVRNGGVFVCTVGYEERHASRKLLADLGFAVGVTAEDDAAGVEPVPLGHFKSPFFSADSYMAYVRFHAAWPVYCSDPNRLVISRYPDGKELIVMRRVGKGLVVVLGDTFFAANRNLENEGGQPFEGLRENAVFWRWLVAMVRDGMGEGSRWFPEAKDCTPPAAPATKATKPAAAAEPAVAEPAAEPPSPESEPEEETP
jgi:hypothetical protein